MSIVRIISQTSLVLLLSARAAVTSPPAPRPFHVLRYDVTVQPNLAQRIIRGLVTLDIVALSGNLAAVDLDAADMKILSCGQGRRNLPYVRGNDILRVSFLHPLKSNQKIQITIRYEAAPHSGVRFFNDQMYTVFDTSHWLPCNNRPSDRALYAMHVVAPVGFTVVASGGLVSTSIDHGQTISNWRVERPISTYVFGFAMGRFSIHSDDSRPARQTAHKRQIDGGPGTVSYLVSPDLERPTNPSPPHDHSDGEPDKTTNSAATSSAPVMDPKQVFSITRAAAAFFARKSGVPYPGKSYTEIFAHGDVAQEANQFTLFSENYLSGLIAHPDDSWLLAHELSHQWWGISVTCEDWSDFWLNEGMATYMADAFLEEQYGKERYDKEIERSHQIYRELLINGLDRPLSYHEWTRPGDAGGRLPYHKGAWFLHLLRQEMGDDQFWRGLRQYTSGNWERSVSSHTLETFLEQTCKCNLQNLFNQYVYAL